MRMEILFDWFDDFRWKDAELSVFCLKLLSETFRKQNFWETWSMQICRTGFQKTITPQPLRSGYNAGKSRNVENMSQLGHEQFVKFH